MRLITHNLLKCNIRGLQEDQGYPLIIRSETTEIIPMQYNEDLIKSLIRKINFIAFQSALKDLQLGGALIAMIEERKHSNDEIIEYFSQSEQFWRELHHLFLEFHVVNGILICPSTGREFIVKDGIPNMLLHEDEV